MDGRAVFTGDRVRADSGCAWRHLPSSFGVTAPTAHRWFTIWTDAGGDAWGGAALRATWTASPIVHLVSHRLQCLGRDRSFSPSRLANQTKVNSRKLAAPLQTMPNSHVRTRLQRT